MHDAPFLPRADGARQSGPIALVPLLEAEAWRVEVRDWDGAFAVIVSAGEARVECDEVAACHVLRDALLEAGVVAR